MEIGKDVHARYSWTAGDLTSVRGETEWTVTFDGDVRVCSRNWSVTVPRDHV